MIVPLILLLASLSGVVATVYFGGPEATAPLLVSLVAAFAALILLVAAWLRPRRAWIVLDGSNVMYWQDEVPKLATVRLVLAEVQSLGFTPVVWFDANAGYLLSDRYMGPVAIARALELPRRRVFVAPKGTPADPLLLEGAARLGARVITNDRFRDWAETHPIVQEAGTLVPGVLKTDGVRLKLG